LKKWGAKKSILNRSGTGWEFNCNYYHGCPHGCVYCYAFALAYRFYRIDYETWLKPIPIPNTVEMLDVRIRSMLRRGVVPSDIFVCDDSDPYHADDFYRHRLTAGVVDRLKEAGFPFTVLTKSHLFQEDLERYVGYGRCRVGITLTNMEKLRVYEPYSPPPDKLVEALRQAWECRVMTYLSIEPILPGSNPVEVVEATSDFVDLYDFGALNQRSVPAPFKHLFRVDEEWQAEMLRQLVEYCLGRGIRYSIAVHSKQLCEKYGRPYRHLCLGDLL